MESLGAHEYSYSPKKAAKLSLTTIHRDRSLSFGRYNSVFCSLHHGELGSRAFLATSLHQSYLSSQAVVSTVNPFAHLHARRISLCIDTLAIVLGMLTTSGDRTRLTAETASKRACTQLWTSDPFAGPQDRSDTGPIPSTRNL